MATSSAVPLIQHGFSYHYTDGPNQPPNAVSGHTVSHGGKDYFLRLGATGRNGIGSIHYVYEDHYGNFVAGPDGTDAEPTVDGFGGGGNQVLSANYVVAAELTGFKAFTNFS